MRAAQQRPSGGGQWHYCGVTAATQIPFALTRVAPESTPASTPAAAPTPRPARRRAAWLLAAGVVLLHAALLGLLPRAPGPGWREQPARWVQVRHVVVPLSTAVAPPSALAPQVLPTPRPSLAQEPLVRQELPSAAVPLAPAPLAANSTADATAKATVEATADPTPDPGGQTVPVYATLPPPPATLQFEMRRGMAVGQAQLEWQPGADQDHYRLTLQGSAVGAPAIGWASQGGFDAAGVAPLRYTESRRGRDVRAANFQRDSGRITYSGPAIEHPLVAGAQDRLSWMVQLAAVLAANPALAEPDAQVSMWVAGSRGDAEVWTFTVQGRVALDLPIGHIDNAVHLVREPRRPYDTQVQVWLDPQRHHLPVQALLRVRATGEGTELRLQRMVAP